MVYNFLEEVREYIKAGWGKGEVRDCFYQLTVREMMYDQQ